MPESSTTEARFVSPCPQPTEHEREALVITIEECSEVIQACAAVQQRATKMLRFGVDEVQPGTGLSNLVRLSTEVGDLRAVLELASRAGMILDDVVEEARIAKHAKLAIYMQTEAPTRPEAAAPSPLQAVRFRFEDSPVFDGFRSATGMIVATDATRQAIIEWCGALAAPEYVIDLRAQTPNVEGLVLVDLDGMAEIV